MRKFPQSGEYRVDSAFAIKAGCWGIYFRKGDKLDYDESTKVMLRFNNKHKVWFNVTPPIDGEDTFALPLYHGEKILAEKLIACDHDNIQELTLEEVENLLGFKLKLKATL
jgi:hypothetical protein